MRGANMATTPLTDLARRLLVNVDANRGDYAPSMMTISAEEYRDTARFARELEAVYRRSPLLVALSVDIPDPGDFTTMEIVDRPIVVMRGDDGVARTFLNVCRHRGRSVAQGCFGHGRRITCPYHSWVYDMSGQLVGVPGGEAFDGLDGDGLIEYPTAE